MIMSSLLGVCDPRVFYGSSQNAGPSPGPGPGPWSGSGAGSGSAPALALRFGYYRFPSPPLSVR